MKNIFLFIISILLLTNCNWSEWNMTPEYYNNGSLPIPDSLKFLKLYPEPVIFICSDDNKNVYDTFNIERNLYTETTYITKPELGETEILEIKYYNNEKIFLLKERGSLTIDLLMTNLTVDYLTSADTTVLGCCNYVKLGDMIIDSVLYKNIVVLVTNDSSLIKVFINFEYGILQYITSQNDTFKLQNNENIQ